MPDGKPISARKAKRIKVINAVDLFCGAGGTSSGLIAAVNALGMDIKLTAINHWDIAIATHTKNHEHVAHFCQSIETLRPIDIIKGRRLQLLVASPECTHHSRARGGMPRSDQKRADAWLLLRWIQDLYVENILIENVKEFQEWGPLNAKGLPDKRYKGDSFRAFIKTLEINYTVEYKVLNCADYGDPTTRERFFLIAKRGKGKKIVWPERTHASRKELALAAAQPSLFEETKLLPWVPAKDIIDWDLEGNSIFGRKKALSRNTMRRIFAGMRKYSGINITLAAPDMATQYREFAEKLVKKEAKWRKTQIRPSGRKSRIPAGPYYGGEFIPLVDKPPKPGEIVVADDLTQIRPFIVPQFSSPDTRDVEQPLGVITTTSRGVRLVEGEVFQLNLKGSDRRDREIDEPTFTQVAGGNHQGVVETNPFLVKQYGESPESRSKPVDDTLGTITANFNHHYLAEPEAFTFNMAHTSNDDASMCKPVDDTLPTIAGKGMFAIVETEPVPFIVSAAHGGNTNPPRDIEEPIGSVLGTNKFGVVEPEAFLISAGGPELPAKETDEPVRSILTRDHQALVTAEPYIVPTNHGTDERTHSTDDPMKVITGFDAFGLAEPEALPFVVPFFGERQGQEPRTRDIEEPAPTVTAQGRMGLAEPSIINMKGKSGSRPTEEPTFCQTTKEHQALLEADAFVLGQQSGSVARETGEPVPTIAGSGAISLVEPNAINLGDQVGTSVDPFLVQFYINGENVACIYEAPGTWNKGDRIGLCIPTLGVVLDIRFRMLQPHELAAAMSFPAGYEFTGNREEKVKQIGNAVPLRTAKALAQAILMN